MQLPVFEGYREARRGAKLITPKNWVMLVGLKHYGRGSNAALSCDAMLVSRVIQAIDTAWIGGLVKCVGGQKGDVH